MFLPLVIVNDTALYVYITFVYNYLFASKYVFESLLLLLLGLYLGMELLGHMVSLHVTLEEPLNCFPQQLHSFTFPQAMCKLKE